MENLIFEKFLCLFGGIDKIIEEMNIFVKNNLQSYEKLNKMFEMIEKDNKNIMELLKKLKKGEEVNRDDLKNVEYSTVFTFADICLFFSFQSLFYESALSGIEKTVNRLLEIIIKQDYWWQICECIRANKLYDLDKISDTMKFLADQINQILIWMIWRHICNLINISYATNKLYQRVCEQQSEQQSEQQKTSRSQGIFLSGVNWMRNFFGSLSLF